MYISRRARFPDRSLSGYFDGRRLIKILTRLILVLRAQFRGRFFYFFIFFLEPPHPESTILKSCGLRECNAPTLIIVFRLLTVVVFDSFILLTTHRNVL